MRKWRVNNAAGRYDLRAGNKLESPLQTDEQYEKFDYTHIYACVIECVYAHVNIRVRFNKALSCPQRVVPS